MLAHRNLFECIQLEIFLEITFALSETAEVETKLLLKRLTLLPAENNVGELASKIIYQQAIGSSVF